jgi:hypothetical protein
MADKWLEEQIDRERRELANAPKIPIASLQPRGGNAGRCSFCGRIARNLVLVEVTHGMERFKGECCRSADGVREKVWGR